MKLYRLILLFCCVTYLFSSCSSNNEIDFKNYFGANQDSLRQEVTKLIDENGMFITSTKSELKKSNRLNEFIIISDDGLFLKGNLSSLDGIKSRLIQLKKKKLKKVDEKETIWILLEVEKYATKESIIDVLVLLRNLDIESKNDFAGEFYREMMGK